MDMTKKLSAALATAFAAVMIAPAVSQAATIEVNTEADTTVPNGCTTDPACSLRDAVSVADVNADIEDTIVIPAGTYDLTNGELELDAGGNTIVFDGAATRTTTIDAGANSRIFNFINGDIRLEDLTITDGSAPAVTEVGEDFPGDGGGILTIAPSLQLDRVALAGNTAELNGGGLAAPPEDGSATALTINESTVNGNTITGGLLEGLGGGLYVLGDLTVTNSTISGNSVDNPGVSQGGGVVAAIDPVETDGTTLSVLNSTIADNTLGTGGMGAGVSVVNPTPGVVTTVELKNTIVAGNTVAGTEGDCSLLAVPTSDNNLAGDGSCQFTDDGSLQNTDPQLGPLADNDGPTDTRALAAGSPAIDAGTNDGCPPTDQRGVTRPQGVNCDIGAFERVPDPPPPPPAEPSANLAVTLKAKPKKARAGKRVKLTITGSNIGPDAANGTVLQGKLPKSVKKLKGSSGCKLAKKKGKGRRFKCQVGELAAGSKVKLKARARVDAKGHRLRLNARITSPVADPDTKNNKAKKKVKVKRRKR